MQQNRIEVYNQIQINFQFHMLTVEKQKQDYDKQLIKKLNESKRKVLLYRRQSAREKAAIEWKKQKQKQTKIKSRGKMERSIKITCWKKTFICIKEIFFQCFNKKGNQKKLCVRSEDLLETIQELREKLSKNKSQKNNLVNHKQGKHCLVFDLEGTLTYSSRQKMTGCTFKSRVEWDGLEIELYTKVRPGLFKFLQDMSKFYEVIVYTSSEKCLAKPILNEINKDGVIKHKLFRDKCINLNEVYYLKDVHKLNRDPSKVVFIDCNVATGVLQPPNFYQITRYAGSSQDRQLEKLELFLRWLATREEVTPVCKNYQIFLQDLISQLVPNQANVDFVVQQKVNNGPKSTESFDDGKSSEKEHQMLRFSYKDIQQNEEKLEMGQINRKETFAETSDSCSVLKNGQKENEKKMVINIKPNPFRKESPFQHVKKSSSLSLLGMILNKQEQLANDSASRIVRRFPFN